MPLFGNNRKIGEHLEKKSKAVYDRTVGGKTYTAAEQQNRPAWSSVEVTNYFLGVGFDHKGDLQSYLYEKGSRTTVEVKVDLVALAAACAGCPMPETPLVAELGLAVKVEKTTNNMLMVIVGPPRLSTGDRTLGVEKNIAFLAMTGYRFDGGISVSAEVGVKTPDVPGIPKPTGGEWSTTDPKVEGGTYAELAAFELGARATAKASAGITGQRMYVSDPVPTFLARGSGSPRDEIHALLSKVLESGDKKAVLKEHVEAFFDSEPQLKPFKPVLSSWKRHVTGGGITTDTFIEQLKKAAAALPHEQHIVDACGHHIKSLRDYRAQAVLEPYCYLAMWSVKPEASAGVSATATASVKASVCVAGGGAEASVTLKGPSIGTTLKFSFYRLQYMVPAVRRSLGRARRAGAVTSRSEVRPGDNPHHYIVTSQDTRINYGQMDLTAIGIDAKVELGVQQGLVSGETFQTERTGELQREHRANPRHRSSLGEATGEAGVSYGIEELKVGVSGSAALKKTLNFMNYDSAVAIWAPPEQPGRPGEVVSVRLSEGSGFAFGQSVDSANLWRQYKNNQGGPGIGGYFEGLAGSIGVAHSQMKAFLESCGPWIEIFGEGIADNAGVAPEAFLVEATFKPKSLPSVEAKWTTGRWTLGPFGVGKTLRDALTPAVVNDPRMLQAIRLRYRRADKEAKARTRFSLGFKYIASLGIKYESIENAGSESIINVHTHWFNEFERFNTLSDLSVAHDTAVPQVALVHQ